MHFDLNYAFLTLRSRVVHFTHSPSPHSLFTAVSPECFSGEFPCRGFPSGLSPLGGSPGISPLGGFPSGRSPEGGSPDGGSPGAPSGIPPGAPPGSPGIPSGAPPAIPLPSLFISIAVPSDSVPAAYSAPPTYSLCPFRSTASAPQVRELT